MGIESLKDIRPDKFMNTMIIEYMNEKGGKGKEEEGDLRKRSKLFLKEVL